MVDPLATNGDLFCRRLDASRYLFEIVSLVPGRYRPTDVCSDSQLDIS